jgi:hypothetical protein
MLKERAKAKAKPSTAELGEMLTVARTVSTPDNTSDGKLARESPDQSATGRRYRSH